MVNRPCWYIVKDGSVMGIADAPVNMEDLTKLGYEVIESNHYEPEIQKIKTIINGTPVLKPLIHVNTRKNQDGSIDVTASSDNYVGGITIFIYNKPFHLEIGQTLTIVPLDGYPLNLTVDPDPTLYVVMGGVQ